jgi:hypothetical protein
VPSEPPFGLAIIWVIPAFGVSPCNGRLEDVVAGAAPAAFCALALAAFPIRAMITMYFFIIDLTWSGLAPRGELIIRLGVWNLEFS